MEGENMKKRKKEATRSRKTIQKCSETMNTSIQDLRCDRRAGHSGKHLDNASASIWHMDDSGGFEVVIMHSVIK